MGLASRLIPRPGRWPASEPVDQGKEKKMLELVKLKNGSSEYSKLVVTTILSLETVIDKQPAAFYDIVEICKNPGYELFEVNADYLVSRDLLKRAGYGKFKVHDSIRNIVLSAVEGSRVELVLGSPIADAPTINNSPLTGGHGK